MLTDSDIAGPCTVIEVQQMIAWFSAHYEAPVHCFPYTEGDYVWIYGGPHDAEKELRGQFPDAPITAILAAVAILEEEEYQWVKRADMDEFTVEEVAEEFDAECDYCGAPTSVGCRCDIECDYCGAPQFVGCDCESECDHCGAPKFAGCACESKCDQCGAPRYVGCRNGCAG